MKPIILTTPEGVKVRLSPLHVVGWAEQDVTPPRGSTRLGSAIILAGATERRNVLETAEQVDWIFERATEDAPPPRRASRPYPEDEVAGD